MTRPRWPGTRTRLDRVMRAQGSRPARRHRHPATAAARRRALAPHRRRARERRSSCARRTATTALPWREAAQAAAHRLSGAASHTTAALHYGLEGAGSPRPTRTSPSGAKRSLPAARPTVSSCTGATSTPTTSRRLGDDSGAHRHRLLPRPTVRRGPAVADSARRAGAAARRRSSPGADVAAAAAARSRRCECSPPPTPGRRPLRVVLRAIALRCARARGRAADDGSATTTSPRGSTSPTRTCGIVLEADSHEFHTERKASTATAAATTRLVARDWLVLRFTWEQVMFEPECRAPGHRGSSSPCAGRRAVRRLRTGRLTGSKPRKAS